MWDQGKYAKNPTVKPVTAKKSGDCSRDKNVIPDPGSGMEIKLG